MAKYIVDGEARTVRFEFGEGADESAVFELDRVPEDMKIQLALHGAKQKLVDAFADAKARPAGISRESYCAAQVETRMDALYAGNWSVRGEGTARISIFAEALAEATGQALDATVKLWADMPKAKRDQVKRHPEFARIVTRLRMERERARLEGMADATDAPPIEDLIG